MKDTVSLKVRQERLQRGLSMRQLAAQSGIAIRTLRRIEAGEGQAFDHTLAKLALAMDLPAEHFDPAPEEAAS